MIDGESTLYRCCTPVVDAEYRGEDDRSPTGVILDALAAAADVDPLELPPIYDAVDPDVVDNLFERRHGGSNDRTALSFRVETWNVFVRADGKVRVCDSTRPTEPEPVFERHTA